MNRFRLYIKIWLWTGVLLTTAMVIIGGITRLTDSGLSIVEWKIVTGVVPPTNELQWETEFEKYKRFPEYKKVNFLMSLSEFKRIYAWEYIHRLLGRLIGVVFLIPFVFFWIKKGLSGILLKRLSLIFLLGALQGVAGWFMVWSGLQEQPHVSHFRLALHLVLALSLISVILWTILELDQKSVQKVKKKMFFPYLCLLLLAIQIILGAFVAGLKAGYSYNNFPWMGESFFPSSAIFKSTPILYNGVIIQFLHRWFACLVLGALLFLSMIARSQLADQKYYKLILLLASLQVLLGVLTLVLNVPLVLGVAHQLLAVVLFAFILAVISKLRFVI